MTKWKRTESVKQIGKQNGVRKIKWERNIIFFGKKKKLPIKIFLRKKNYYLKTHPIHMTMHVHDAS